MPIEFGLTLSSEEHPPSRLVEMATMAEEAGFDFVSISDHYHPWIDAQGHSPFVWSVLGAISQVTDEIDVCVGVTCPTTRIHPAILAQATATTANLLPDRFIWGVGTGEALNEHILADRWPPAEIRLEKLEEAVELIRELWKGESVNHRGTYYTVEDARIYDPPPGPIPVIVSAFGPKAASVAARIGDGLWISGTDDEIVDLFGSEGGSGPVFSQLSLCHASSKEKAVETAFTTWPNTGVPGQLSQDLPTPGPLPPGIAERHPGDDRRVHPLWARRGADPGIGGSGDRGRRPTTSTSSDRSRPGGLHRAMEEGTRAGVGRAPGFWLILSGATD